MGYRMKWVVENLGVSRKAIRGYEEIGLLERKPDQWYREFSDQDIALIQRIRIMQELNYSLRQIKEMFDDPTTSLSQHMSRKIASLERQRDEIDRLIGYAQLIKVSGWESVDARSPLLSPRRNRGYNTGSRSLS